MERRLGIEVRPVDSGQECVEGVDIVNVITTAARPVLLGEWLSAGAHVNAAGNNHWMKQEIDSDVVRRASVIVADDVDGAKIECGDLVDPIDRGITTWNHVRNLSDVVTGQDRGPRVGRRHHPLRVPGTRDRGHRRRYSRLPHGTGARTGPGDALLTPGVKGGGARRRGSGGRYRRGSRRSVDSPQTTLSNSAARSSPWVMRASAAKRSPLASTETFGSAATFRYHAGWRSWP